MPSAWRLQCTCGQAAGKGRRAEGRAKKQLAAAHQTEPTFRTSPHSVTLTYAASIRRRESAGETPRTRVLRVLFNSYPFLLLFLPAALAGYFLLGRIRITWGAGWLALASLAFYAWWDPRYVPLLLGSIVFNYLAGRAIGRAQGIRPARAKWLLALAIAANLGLLGYFKYADFFIASVNSAAGTNFGLLRIVLPLGISFFTFTQIAFLADAYGGLAKDYRFVHYVLFVTYFPHLIAGPILHHREMIPQFDDPAAYRPQRENFEVGLTIFAIGLAKKVLIADSLAPHAGAFFSAPGEPGLLVAWGGVLAYAFQLYFDFSGYSDMAIGLSRLFGIQLPINFNSPYKAHNITEFWRRWHMTLSRFLRDYLYIALGGNRKGPARRYFNLMATMVLGGLWHGAGWTFVIWGALHGLYLAVNHAWLEVKSHLPLPRWPSMGRAIGIFTTFIAVCIAWVYFRAPDVGTAHQVLRGMFGTHGIGLPAAIGERLGTLRPLLESLGVQFFLGGGARFAETYAWVALAAVIAFNFPNTQEIMRNYKPGLGAASGAVADRTRFAWRPTSRWATAIGVLAAACLIALDRPAEFLYFQF